MVHRVANRVAVDRPEIPSGESRDVAGCAGGWMRAAGGNTGGIDEGVLAAGQLPVRIENVKHTSAITDVQRSGNGMSPVGGLNGTVKQKRLERARVRRRVGGSETAVPARPGLHQQSRRPGDERRRS